MFSHYNIFFLKYQTFIFLYLTELVSTIWNLPITMIIEYFSRIKRCHGYVQTLPWLCTNGWLSKCNQSNPFELLHLHLDNHPFLQMLVDYLCTRVLSWMKPKSHRSILILTRFYNVWVFTEQKNHLLEYFTFFHIICELFRTKASPKRILTYCQLDISEVHTF